MGNVKQSHPTSSHSFTLRGIGPQLAKRLARLDIYSDRDLVFHLPVRYQDRTRVVPLRMLHPGKEAVVQGEIVSVSAPPKGKTKLLCMLQDETGYLSIRFFHLLPFQKELLKTGRSLRCFGEVRLGHQGFEMMHPEFEVLHDKDEHALETTLTPIYPATEGVSQYRLRKLSAQALAWMDKQSDFNEVLPGAMMDQYQLMSLKEALRFVHYPPHDVPMSELQECRTPAHQRMVFEELLAHRLSLLQVKASIKNHKAKPFLPKDTITSQLLSSLPFSLTHAQTRVVKEVASDLARDTPMLRLVQGDVGSGKTVVAVLAMLQVVEHGMQAALMAPTELLAEQHYRVMKAWLEPLNVHVVFLSGSVKAAARAQALTAISSGDAQVVIGTHALFQQEVVFASLGLVVTDEQHRFGVEQRALLREKGVDGDVWPHQLIMTATPIPRTLSMSYYADLDCSVIDELPPGRTPVVTSVISNDKREDVIARVRTACTEGRQVYWVCPLIEASEVIDGEAATVLAEHLRAALPELKIGLVHGRMTSSQKEQAMRAFQYNEAQLLVATTVIEVGVDVPNASVMIIENAERLGLSQLHQLRGRVGRGAQESFCILLYRGPLSTFAKERLQVMRSSTDGFYIAQRDLELRGPGEVLGTQQTGDLSFRVADLLRDSAMLTSVSRAADQLMKEDAPCIEKVVLRWLGRRVEYGVV